MQDKDIPCQGKMYKRKLAFIAYMHWAKSIEKLHKTESLNSDSFHTESKSSLVFLLSSKKKKIKDRFPKCSNEWQN